MSADLFVTEYQIDCPQGCGRRSTLTLRGWGELSSVHLCGECREETAMISFEVPFTAAGQFMDEPEVTVYQHQDGLVTFGGAR